MIIYYKITNKTSTKALSITAKRLSVETITETYIKKERRDISIAYVLDTFDCDKMFQLS